MPSNIRKQLSNIINVLILARQRMGDMLGYFEWPILARMEFLTLPYFISQCRISLDKDQVASLLPIFYRPPVTVLE
jgi:hypothetical protein